MTLAHEASALNRGDILNFLCALDAELAESEPSGEKFSLFLCGGAVMAILGLRDSTLDIDSMVKLDPRIKTAAERVASGGGSGPIVLNDAASAWLPATFDPRECPIVLDGEKIITRRASYDALFVMKLNASRPHAADLEDLASLAPLVSFQSAEEIQLAHDEAYPAALSDPLLGQHAWDRYIVPALSTHTNL